jgi:hypothetical protein
MFSGVPPEADIGRNTALHGPVALERSKSPTGTTALETWYGWIVTFGFLLGMKK